MIAVQTTELLFLKLKTAKNASKNLKNVWLEDIFAKISLMKKLAKFLFLKINSWTTTMPNSLRTRALNALRLGLFLIVSLNTAFAENAMALTLQMACLLLLAKLLEQSQLSQSVNLVHSLQ